MAKGVFVHRADSKYDDFPEERYQFPKRYLKRAINFEKDWIVYYEPRGGGGSLSYVGIAKVDSIKPDRDNEGMFVALIEAGTFLPFEQKVPFRVNDVFKETDLRKPDGTMNGGLIQWAIRPISDRDFQEIVLEGFSNKLETLPRVDNDIIDDSAEGFSESNTEFVFDSDKERVERTISLIPRDRVFRKVVLDAYNCRCAITGLKLINGGGRAEVEAAHIKPVASLGPDTIRNGLALSGTVHWMFDRGLISLSNELEVLVSRQVNDAQQIRSLINETGYAFAPENPAHHPHPKFLEWHRDNCFKV